MYNMISLRWNELEKIVYVPLNLTVDELFCYACQIYNVDSQLYSERNHYLIGEDPICLLQGQHILQDYHIRRGSVIYLPYKEKTI